MRIDSLDAHAERFFVRLMMKCDDYGRFHSDPLLLKSALFPLKPDIRPTDISRWLAECDRAGLLRCYVAANSRKYIEVLNFKQRRQWMKSEHPPPEGQMSLPIEPQKNLRAPCRSRSRREEENVSANARTVEDAAVPPIRENKKPEYWQLQRDENALTDRIKIENGKPKPDSDLVTALKNRRSAVREQMKTV